MNKKNTKIQLPSLLLIPAFSILFSVAKALGGADDWNWIVTLVVAPMMTYLMWSIGFVILAFVCFKVLNMINGRK